MHHREIDMIIADLAIMEQAERAAREVLALTDRVDALLNNADGIGAGLVITPEGNEATFAGNHLGPFLFTRELLPILKETVRRVGAGKVRVVNVSSQATDLASGLDWNNLQLLEEHVAPLAYCNVYAIAGASASRR